MDLNNFTGILSLSDVLGVATRGGSLPMARSVMLFFKDTSEGDETKVGVKTHFWPLNCPSGLKRSTYPRQRANSAQSHWTQYCGL